MRTTERPSYEIATKSTLALLGATDIEYSRTNQEQPRPARATRLALAKEGTRTRRVFLRTRDEGRRRECISRRALLLDREKRSDPGRGLTRRGEGEDGRGEDRRGGNGRDIKRGTAQNLWGLNSFSYE